MDFIAIVGAALLKELGYGDELQLKGRCTEPTRCVISFVPVAAFEAESVVKQNSLK